MNIIFNRQKYGKLNARQDALMNFLIHKIEKARLVDVVYRKSMPTWRNNKSGEAGI